MGFFFTGVICLFAIFTYNNFIIKSLTYQDLDLIIKTISGIGAIVGGFFVYFKWNDEKKRNIYERRLQEVYAPLIKLLIRQEQFRKMYLSDESNIDKAPILTTACGTLKNKKFVDLFEGMNAGLASPHLLKLMTRYKLVLEIEKKQRDILKHEYPELDTVNINEQKKREIEQTRIGIEYGAIIKQRVVIERELVTNITENYNKTVEALGFDKEKINIRNL